MGANGALSREEAGKRSRWRGWRLFFFTSHSGCRFCGKSVSFALKGFEEEVELSRDHTAPLVICHHLHIRRNLSQKSKTRTLSHTGSAVFEPIFGRLTTTLQQICHQTRRLHKNTRREHVRRSWVGYGSSEEPPPPQRVGTFALFRLHISAATRQSATDEKGVCVWS